MHLFNEFTKKEFSGFFMIDYTTDIQTEQLTKEMGELLQDDEVFEEWKTLHKIVREDFDAKDRIKGMLLKSHFEEKFPMLAELQQILTDQYIKKEIDGISMMRIYREKLDELLTSETS